ncbi:MAG: alanine racemase, partial [Planctomycetota bacterium]
MSHISVSVAAVRARIAAACHRNGRNPAEIELVAVTKTQSPEVLADLASAGVRRYGENRVEHLADMVNMAPAGSVFDYIGRVQSRQFAAIVSRCQRLHSLAELGHVAKLDRACAQAERRIGVFVQVNTAGEMQKAGLSPDALPAMLDAVRAADHLDLLGL